MIGNFTPAGTLCCKYRQKNSSSRLQVKVTRQKVPDLMQVLMVSSVEEPQWEEFSHRFEWQAKARDRERQGLGNLQPRASWRTEEEMHRMSFFFFCSHTFVFSRHPGRWEAPNTPAHLPCPPLCVRTKIVEGLCLSPLPSVSFKLAPKPPEARFFTRHCQKWTYSPASL